MERQLTNNMSISVSYVGSEGHFLSASKAIGSHNNENPESLAALAAYNRDRHPMHGHDLHGVPHHVSRIGGKPR